MGDTIVDKAKGRSGEPKDKGSSGTSGSGVKSKGGLSKGVDKDEIDLEEFIETSESEDLGDVEAEMLEAEQRLGYPLPITFLEMGGKGTGKSSDWISPDIPRPVANQKVTILTASRETRTAIFDRWGGIPEYAQLFRGDLIYDPTDLSTASEVFAAVEKFIEEAVESGGLCNVVLDDLEHWYEEVAVNKCRHEFGVERGEIPFDKRSTDFWTRRKHLGKDLVALATDVARHIFTVSGYDETVTKEMQEIDGQRQLVEVVEDPRWAGVFEKPFDITLYREKSEGADEDTQGDIIRTIKVLTSKVNRLFPEGARYNVQGPGIAKFWNVYEEQREAGDVTMHDATQQEEPEDED